MPTQDNCDDLKVESCVDENGQTINGGDSYEVPTGRYVKHVVNVCGTGASGSGPAMKVCGDGGLQIVGSDDAACMQIKTEPNSALVLDGGFLKIDSTNLNVTSDNVYPAGTDPGLLSTLPAFTGPEGESWSTQQDYNRWVYDELKKLKMVHYGQPMPTDPNLGALWTDDTNYKQYVFNGNEWVEVTSCTGDGEPKHETYIEFYRLKVSLGAYSHNGDSITGSSIDIWWNSTEGKDYYDGEWYWEIDMLGDDNWVKHEDLPQDFLDSINFIRQSNSKYTFEASIGATYYDWFEQHPKYPCARARLTASNYSRVNPNDFTILTSGPCPLFPNDTYSDSEPPTDDKYFPICKP